MYNIHFTKPLDQQVNNLLNAVVDLQGVYRVYVYRTNIETKSTKEYYYTSIVIAHLDSYTDEFEQIFVNHKIIFSIIV